MKEIQALVLILMLLVLGACKKDSDEEDLGPFKGMSAKELYLDGKKSFTKKQYASAVKRFEALESIYPFSDYAKRSQMLLIDAYYQDEKYPMAAAAAERYIHLYPRAKRVDKAYYLKALANFQQVRGPLAKLLPIDESWRDPGTQLQAYMDFANLVQRFPESSYKNDSLQRMIYLRNMFAQREYNTADYYFQRKMYVAAAERAAAVIKSYPQAESAKPALALLYKANLAMGLNKAAADALKVYEDTYHAKPAGA